MTGWDIIANLVSTLIAFSFGWSAQRWMRRTAFRRPSRKIWRIDQKRDTHIITADGPMIDHDEYTTVVYPVEYAAASEISSYLSRYLGLNIRDICVSRDFPRNHALEDNLIIIGGPIHNGIYRAIAEHLPLPYGFDGHDLVRFSDGHRFCPKLEHDAIVKDIGFVVVAPNPFKRSSLLVILAGAYTFGCVVAARALVEPLVGEAASKLQRYDEELFLVVEADIINQYVGKLRIIDSTSRSRTSINADMSTNPIQGNPGCAAES